MQAALEPAEAPLAEGTASVRTFAIGGDQRRIALAVYVLGANELLVRDTPSPQFVAWQHIVTHADSGRPATAETISLGPADHVVGRVSDDPPFLAETLAALEMARNSSGDADYELRMMIVPAVYALAVWLSNVAGDTADRFIVVSAGELFDSGALLDAETWYAALRTEARRLRA